MTPPPLSHATTPRSAARRGAITLGVGGVAALGFGAMVSAFPVALVAVFAVPAVILFPLMGVGIAVLSDGVAFPALITGFSTTLINIGVLGAVIAALPVALIRRRANTIVIKIAAALAATSITGMVIALIAFPTSQWLSGARYFLVPIAVAVLASALNDRQLRVLLRAVAALMAASFAAAIVETALGSDRLLELTGLEYGTSIRNFGTALRAPGTFATNYHLGAFSSVIAVVALLWWSSLEGARKDIIWRIVALISAVGCLALSTYRTGVVVLIVSVVAAVFLSGDAVKRWVKISVAVTGIAVGVGFFAVGLGDSKSFFQRLDIWAQLL
ncbi:MAG: hypothetical protein JWQ43_722, partial [Glaciihabitans sp.]|nr:hypothetical protein [Glaciihabitans sp.]